MTMEYIVKVENFEGPFDLLLELIQKKEMDIFDIRISDITNDYIESIRAMQHHQIEVTADFMEMASVLLSMKTRMMLPNEKEEAEEELKNRIIDYKEYKEAAERLREMKEIEEKYFKRQKQEKVKKQKKGTISDIANIYKQVLEFKKSDNQQKNKLEELNKETFRFKYSIEEQMAYLKSILQSQKISVYDMFMNMDDKEEIVETFGAILELCKIQYINITIENDTFFIERRE